ncbi:MAG: hypothetical protein FWF05_03895 [Oscillospiraceae bacterium]|nr:hypothetical protein [Oscillospiraceae bacterium]
MPTNTLDELFLMHDNLFNEMREGANQPIPFAGPTAHTASALTAEPLAKPKSKAKTLDEITASFWEHEPRPAEETEKYMAGEQELRNAPPQQHAPDASFSPPAANDNTRDFWNDIGARAFESGEAGERAETSVIGDKQLRALSKKHLMLMLRDLEKELQSEKREKRNMILAFRAGITQRQGGWT